MESNIEISMPETQEANVKLIYYLNNNKKDSGNLKFSYENEFERISYNDITFSFYSFLKEKQENEKENSDLQFLDIKQNNIIYKSIRYKDGDGWLELKKENVIFLDDELNLNNLEIMIYSDILSEKKTNIKKKYDKIDKEINYIYNQITKKKNNLPPLAPLNLVVLTANPLMDGEKELRTMNDFNIITSEIYKAFEEEYYLKYTQFSPLTFNNLKNAITIEQTRPVILHLICKSTYVIPEEEKENKSSDNSEDYANLIFEEDNNYTNLEFINKKRLEEEIFNYDDNPELKGNVSKMVLIISTPLAMDVYNIFKNFGFKNILIQHTTPADVNFVANFNYTFYNDIITHLDQPINKIYEDALTCDVDNINPPAFCCCFHKHKTTCYLFNNLKNELYNDNDRKNIDELIESIPHFYHLYPDCFFVSPKCDEKIDNYKLNLQSEEIEFPKNSFCCHLDRCYQKYKNLPKPQKKTITLLLKDGKKEKPVFCNYCCCKEEAKIHNKNNVFIKDFSAENKNNEIRFRNAELFREKPLYVPNYDKMISSIGNNKVIYRVINFLLSRELSLDIYGDNLENLKILGNIIIEYHQEKYFQIFESSKSMLNLNRNNSAINLNSNYNTDISEDNSIDEDFSLRSMNSTPLLKRVVKFNIEQIDLKSGNCNNIINIFQEKKNNNKIYFIYVADSNLKDAIKNLNLNNKIVWFIQKSKEENNIIEDNNILLFKEEPILQDDKYYKNKRSIIPNEYLKFQNIKTVRNIWRKPN